MHILISKLVGMSFCAVCILHAVESQSAHITHEEQGAVITSPVGCAWLNLVSLVPLKFQDSHNLLYPWRLRDIATKNSSQEY